MTKLSTGWLLALVAVGVASLQAQAQMPSTLYGHQAQTEATEAELAAVGHYRESGRMVKLLKPAAAAFQKMQQAARREGVELVPISGYRSRAYQQGLFQRAVRKYGSEEAAARWVAPPGYSHHQTGLALDIGDGKRARCDVQGCFRETPAYAWLVKNAAGYGFILFFTGQKPGELDEPWHWHYEGATGTGEETKPAAE